MMNDKDQKLLQLHRLSFVDIDACELENHSLLPFWELSASCLLIVTSGTVSLRMKEVNHSEWDDWNTQTATPIKKYTDILLHEGEAVFLSEERKYMMHSESSTALFRIFFHGGEKIPFAEYFKLTDPMLLLQYISFLRRNFNDSGRRFLCDANLALIIGEAIQQKNASEKNASVLCENIVKYISEHSDRQIHISELADAFSYSADHIARVFKQYYPEGIKQYIVCERINRIKYLLLTTDLPIKELAITLNFSAYKQFHKFFTYHEHMSPTEFRKIFESSEYNQ